MTDPLVEAWTPEQVAAMEGLRSWAVGHAEMNQHLAAWTSLPTADANALGHVVWAAEGGAPLSPAQLARRLGMTSGATTVLLNRLESAGLLVRSRESADRRRVTLRPSPRGREQTRTFTAFAGAEVADALRTTSAADLRAAAAFLQRMSAAVVAANSRLDQHRRAPARDGAAPPAAAPG